MAQGTPKIITASRANMYTDCARRHWYRYQEHLTGEATAGHFKLGDAIHKALEHWWISKKDGSGDAVGAVEVYESAMDVTDPYLYARGAAMLTAYCDVWKADHYRTLEVEKEFILPLPDPVFGGDNASGWQIAGKIDAIIEDTETGAVFIMDHKTSAYDLNPNSAYWQTLAFDKQISMYILAARIMGHDVAGFIYDVLKVPACKEKLATPQESRKYTKAGALYANQRDTDEPAIEYLGRVNAKILEDIEGHFHRYTVPRGEGECERFLDEITAIADAIDRQSSERANVRNTKSCSSYGSTCPFLPFCAGWAAAGDAVEGVVTLKPFQELQGVQNELFASVDQ